MQIEIVNPGESLWSISRRYGVPEAEIIRLNAINNPSQLVVGQALVIPTSGRNHTVQPGESLYSIARRYGVTVESIVQLNQITSPAAISVGMVLRIPVGEKMTIESNAYLIPATAERDRTLVNSTAEFLTYFSIFQYRVTREGELVAPNDEAALAAIRNTNSAPMMVITNFEEGTFSADIGRAIFTNAEVRRRLITSIATVMREKRFFALNIDFEHLYAADRERYNSFLREITASIHAQGQLVSTALAPKESATQVGQWYEAHDYAAHGEIVDFVIIMTYEWGWSGGPPMAVAPIPQVRRVIEFAVSVIPHQKIMMGAPLYGYDWTLPYVPGGKFARSLGPVAAVDQALRVGARIQFDPVAQAPNYNYYDGERRQHVVWFEDARSMQAKFDLIKQYRLRGISYWVLGNEFPQNWALLADNFRIRKLK